jgi:hypothetical protein
VLTVGANDIPTVDLTVQCILAYLTGQACAGWWDSPFQDSDIAWIHDTVFPMITQYLRQAAGAVPGVRFLDLATALEGRQVCTPDIGHDQERMWGAFVDLSGLRIGVGPHLFSQSLHPNAVGYGYLAGCLRDFHALQARDARCVRGADGQVRLIAQDP